MEVAHQGLSKLVLVETMHERKAFMAQEADAFVALPGGFGTLDEFFEILTWAQLGIHAKPCVLVNTAGYYDHLLSFLEVAIDQGFLKPENHALIHVVANATEALNCMQKLWKTLPVSHVPRPSLPPRVQVSWYPQISTDRVHGRTSVRGPNRSRRSRDA